MQFISDLLREGLNRAINLPHFFPPHIWRGILAKIKTWRLNFGAAPLLTTHMSYYIPKNFFRHCQVSCHSQTSAKKTSAKQIDDLSYKMSIFWRVGVFARQKQYGRGSIV